ncbi:MAG: 1-hydroxy-2-methyl-2-(E)-butenyl 4-diphosphate synthase, partial [Bacteroidetes bacterium]
KTTSIDANAQLALDILQALGLRYSKAEFVACPSCGRSCFDIQDHLEKVRKKTAQLKGLKIAVMGCIVNGPGEMAGADYGYVGSGKGIIDLYKGTLLVRKNLDESLAVDALIELIKENGDWQEEK